MKERKGKERKGKERKGRRTYNEKSPLAIDLLQAIKNEFHSIGALPVVAMLTHVELPKILN